MPRKVRQLKADMRNFGFRRRPGKGSHTKWEHHLLPDLLVIISGNDGDDAKPYQEKEVQDALRKLQEVKGK
jgi:hypothetical protein